MTSGIPRIALIGSSHRALCVLERLLERGDQIVAFVGQQGGGDRDFCEEIVATCESAGVPSRITRKLGEEVVRWLEDRIRPDLVIAVGVDCEIPLAIGGNSRLGLLEVIDPLALEGSPGVLLKQRGQTVFECEMRRPSEASAEEDFYLQLIDRITGAIEEFLAQLVPDGRIKPISVPFLAAGPSLDTLGELTSCTDAGAETVALEAELRSYVGAETALALRSRREAFERIFAALGLADGDELVCPPIASGEALEAARSVGAQLVFCDVEPGRLTLDPQRVEACISPRTRALLISHPFGQPANLAELYGLAERAGIEVIEDAGTSFGARIGDFQLGRAPCTCVFRAPLAGEASGSSAALVTLPGVLAERLAPQLADQRLGNGPSGFVRRWLAESEQRIAARRAIALEYSAALGRYDAFEIPATPEDALPIYAGYLLRVTRFARTFADDLHDLLGQRGVETRRLRVSVRERELVKLPVTEAAAAGGLFLPIHAPLTPAQREHLLDTIFDYAIG